MDLSSYIAEAVNEWDDPKQTIDGIPSSPHYDAKLIAWHVKYHTGKWPVFISTSRGNSYNVRIGWYERGKPHKVTISDYKDHRAGVHGLGLGAFV